MNKKQRALRAAKAAKRIPIVGTAVVAEPILEAAASSLSGGRFASIDGWRAFFAGLRYNFVGIAPGNSQVDTGRVLQTWIPIIGYVVATKTGLSKPISRVLGKIGLRF